MNNTGMTGGQMCQHPGLKLQAYSADVAEKTLCSKRTGFLAGFRPVVQILHDTQA
jgi:hypothetical protein